MNHTTPDKPVTMTLRRAARELSLFEFLGRYVGGWRHVKGDGYRELAELWWRCHR